MNAQVTSTIGGGASLTYFPVPANPIDFVLSGSYLLTLSGTPATGDAVFPYSLQPVNGQLTVNQNSSAAAEHHAGHGDRERGQVTSSCSTTSRLQLQSDGSIAASQILPYHRRQRRRAAGGDQRTIPDDANQSNPIYLVVENKGKWFYVANQGNPGTADASMSGIAGYVMNTPFQPTEIAGTPIISAPEAARSAWSRILRISSSIRPTSTIQP